MVRVEEQMEAMNQLGADKIVHANLEGGFGHAMDNADAVIFAAGSGASTGADKTIIVDLWGAMKAIDYAKERGIKRFVQLSG
ncbi:NAD(P)H-binding protein, partial [Salmonella enterica]|uniref:NAD(P)H-binding protein n=1 Tax=Salmonella enterica TaxID=28901 RepID=UPI001F434590